ncbi:hypothetical protein RMATCC62417_07081 [Rhizopus microsporus]|nr:hypothetical protein RMATCC62417_07081 [Rhizopus microsporus]
MIRKSPTPLSLRVCQWEENGRRSPGYITKALRLTTSVRYLEDENVKDKGMAFDIETVERIQQARYEDVILRRTTPRGQQRGRGYERNKSQNYRSKKNQQSFFGRPKNSFQQKSKGTPPIPSSASQ